MIQPQYSPAYAQQAPSTGASAVNIQIYEPKAFSAPATPQAQAMTVPMYNYPQASMYAPGMPMYPYQPYPQQQMPYPYQPYPQQMPYPTAAPITYPPEPQVMPQSAIAEAPAQTPVPVQAPAPAEEAPKVETEQAPAATVVDVAAINQELVSADPDKQTEAITKIAQMSQSEPAIALQLVDGQIMQNLAGIVQKDTTALAGPTNEQIAIAQKFQKGETLTPQEQQLIEQGSPKEMAEKNKVFSMFTLAMLQKLQRDEIEQFNAQAGNAGSAVPPLQIQDLVGFNEITNAIMTSPIPAVKVAGIQALSYVAKPEDLAVIQQVLTPLANDKDADVKQAAQEALAKISTPQQAQEAPAATTAPVASTQG